MQKVGDKIIYNTLGEIMDPSHTALVVWDVQNMLVNRIFNREEFTRNLSSVINFARRADVPIFFIHIQVSAAFDLSVRTDIKSQEVIMQNNIR